MIRLSNMKGLLKKYDQWSMFNVYRVKLKVNSRLRNHDNKNTSLLTCFIQRLRKLKIYKRLNEK